MDVNLYQAVIRRYWMVLLATVVVSAAVVTMVTANRDASYQGSLYVSLAQQPQEPSSAVPFYAFGEFYALQGSNLLADYFLGWLKDPATIKEILVRAGGDIPATSLTRLSRFFQAKPLGSVGVQIFHTTASASETDQTLKAVQDVLGNRLKKLQAEGLYQDFTMVAGEVLVIERQPDLLLGLLIGVLGGLIVAFLELLVLALLGPPPRT